MSARAEKRFVFALGFGEFVTLYRRAISDRPYMIHGTQCDKLKFE